MSTRILLIGLTLWLASPTWAADDLLLDSSTSESGDSLLLDAGGDSLLGSDEPAPGGDDLLRDIGVSDTNETSAGETTTSAAAVHNALFLENKYPSASTCATCHPKQFREWSVSPHGYSQISPVSAAMSATMNILTNGTVGDFCFRCHSPVGGNLGEPIVRSNMDRHPAAREGITCVACHRVDANYGRVNGRLAMREGDITSPIYGPSGNAEVERVLADNDYRVTADPQAKGRKMHGEARYFSPLSESSFCSICHDVTLVNGFRAEETFSEWKNSPAAKRGESCQDCHMGKEPGLAAGYEYGPAAVVGGVPTHPRKLASHLFAGPDYSVVHPGFFPHNVDAQRMASIREWLQFDVDAGWGTDAFENTVTSDMEFPERWSSADDRYDGREIIDQQLALLKVAEEARRKLLSRAYLLGDIETIQADADGLGFKVEFRNGTDGHNAPSGFERVVFLRVTVTDTDGTVIYRSGDLDPNGDLRDMHSAYVRSGELPLDKDLLNLQLKFVTRLFRGGERESILPANYSVDVQPFVRPELNPTNLFNHPLGARVQKKGAESGGSRWASYTVPAENLTGKGPYTAKVELVAGMIPVNLLNEVALGGLDYGMSPREIADRIVDGHQVLWQREVELKIGVDRMASIPGDRSPLGADSGPAQLARSESKP